MLRPPAQDFGGGAEKDLCDAGGFFGRAAAFLTKGCLQGSIGGSDFAGAGTVLVVVVMFLPAFAIESGACEELPDIVQFLAHALKVAQHRIYRGPVLFEMPAPGVGDAIQLLRAVGFDRGISDFLKVGQRRINHSGTGTVETLRPLLQSFHDLVAVEGLFREKREDDEVEIGRCELSTSAKRGPVFAETAGQARREATETACAVVAAQGENPGKKGVGAFGRVVSGHILRYIIRHRRIQERSRFKTRLHTHRDLVPPDTWGRSVPDLLIAMNGILQFVGPNGAVQLFGVKLVGVNATNGKKMLFSLVFLASVWLIAWGFGQLAALIVRQRSRRVAFWTRQGIHLFCAAFGVVGLCSIWFNDPARLATAFGLVTAGLAFALQRVITAFAAYVVILRGKTFSIGDRIVMGGVRGDVIELGFIQTTIMEMGQPPSEQGDAPAMWVHARQYTGRIVTLTNDKIFDTPVYNYTREFPFIWEEMTIPISYQANMKKAEEIILEAVRQHTIQMSEVGEEQLKELERRYFVKRSELDPRVFVRLTDNWIELTVRFMTREHGIREVKDRVSRDMLDGFNAAGIGIASGTYEIVGMPPLSVKVENSEGLGSK